MANKKLDYVKSATIDKILKTCNWLLVLGERSNGKSYASKNLIIKKCIDTGCEMIYLRRYDLDCKDSVCVQYFNDCPVEVMTDGEYSCIDVYRRGIYLANIDEETNKIKRGKKIGYCQALSNSEHYKSLAFPNVEYIIYEEIVSQDGRYLYNEPNKLQHYISTIYRQRQGKVIMIGNTISRICPYYREWNLKVARQKLGTIDSYTFHNDNGNDTRMCVYLTDSLNFNSGMFFGNSAKNITKGAYEVEEYAHLPKNITKYHIMYKVVAEYNEFKFLCQLLRDKETGDIFWFIEPKTTPIQKLTRVISNQFNSDPMWSQSWRDYISDNERRAFSIFMSGKVCYSDNLTGTEFNNILKFIK